jgi:uncharacterized protein
LFENSTPGQAFFLALNHGEILLSTPLAEEINRILYQPKFDRYLTYEQREEFIISLVESSALVDIRETVSVCRDPKDNLILELAVSGEADVIITGDSDLLDINPFRGIAILNPKDFLATYKVQ